MTHIRWEAAAIAIGVERWEELEALMQDARQDLGSASVAGLAPGVQGAASSFLSAWSGYAEESRAIAEGFVGALRDATADMGSTDSEQAGDYGQLDGRLGSGR